MASEQQPLLAAEPVLLHVYDMHPLNGYVNCWGLGAYHSGVEVYGHATEYAYGYAADDRPGIYQTVPMGAADWATPLVTVQVGATQLGPREVRQLVADMGSSWPACTYNLLHRNCNDFSAALCRALVPDASVPRWLNRLAWLGSLVECCLPLGLRQLRVAGEEAPSTASNQTLWSQHTIMAPAPSPPFSAGHMWAGHSNPTP